MIEIVRCLNFLFVLIKRSRCDVAVLGVDVDYSLPCGHIGIPSGSVILGDGVYVTNGAEDELFQCLVHCLLLSPHSLVLSVNLSIVQSFDGGSDACSMRTWVCWNKNVVVERVV